MINLHYASTLLCYGTVGHISGCFCSIYDALASGERRGKKRVEKVERRCKREDKREREDKEKRIKRKRRENGRMKRREERMRG